MYEPAVEFVRNFYQAGSTDSVEFSSSGLSGMCAGGISDRLRVVELSSTSPPFGNRFLMGNGRFPGLEMLQNCGAELRDIPGS